MAKNETMKLVANNKKHTMIILLKKKLSAGLRCTAQK